MRNRSRVLGSFGITMLLILAACGDDDTPTPSNTPTPIVITVAGTPIVVTATPTPTVAPSPIPADAPRGVLNVADKLGNETYLQRTISSEAPVFHLGEPLLWWDWETDGPTTIAILESWDIEAAADGGLVWDLTVRKGVKFHKGNGEVTAEDVKFTMAEHLKPGSNNSWTGMVRQIIGEDPDNITVIDTYSLRITTPQTLPFTEALRSMSAEQQNTLRPFPKKYMQEVGEDEFIRNPVYAGPFEFVRASLGEDLVLEAVPDHYRQPPKFQTLHYFKVDDLASRVSLLKGGQLDIAPVPGRVAAELLRSGLDILVSEGTPEPFVNFMGMFPTRESYDPSVPWNGENPLNENPTKVRQALNLAIDREAIVEKLIFGYGRTLAVSFSFMGPGRPWWNPAWGDIPFDPEGARALMAEAGYPDCFEMTMWLVSTLTFAPDIGEAVASMWETNLGCTVKRRVGEFRPELRAMLVSREVTIKNLTYAFDGNPIARPFRYACFHGGPTYQTVVHTEMPFYDELCRKAEKQLDVAQLAQVEQEIGNMQRKYWATAPIASVDQTYAVNTDKVMTWELQPRKLSIAFLEYAVPR
jgi:peptide/nickel transport system substrate-binding protein